MIAVDLDSAYVNVVREQDVKIVDDMLRAAFRTRVNSIVLTAAWSAHHTLGHLKGLGRDVWRNEDAQVYVDRLRGEWAE